MNWKEIKFWYEFEGKRKFFSDFLDAYWALCEEHKIVGGKKDNMTHYKIVEIKFPLYLLTNRDYETLNSRPKM